MKVTTETLIQIYDETHSKEEFAFELYFIWCETVTINSREFQQVLANKAVSHWFIDELETYRQEYQFLITEYPEASDEDCLNLLIQTVFKIFSRFPKALLVEAKKRTEKTKAGISTIFNQN